MLEPSCSALVPFAVISMAAVAQSVHAGEIIGQITPASTVRSVVAVQRLKNTMKEIRRAEYPATVDRETGRFRIQDLKDGVYDLVVVTARGTIEGVDLSMEGVVRPLPAADREKLQAILDQTDEFMNRKKALFMMGDGRSAKVLMDLCRDREHHMGQDLIWRVEIWQFQNLYGTWQLQGQGMRGRTVLQRVKAPRSEIESLHYLFEPGLGGIPVSGETPVSLPEYRIPEDWNSHPGLSPVRYPSEGKES